MEEIEGRKRRISEHRRSITVCLILLVIFVIPMTPLMFIVRESFYVSRFVSVRIGPFDEEMFINFDFYSSESDTETGGDTIYGHGRRLDPSDSTQEFGFSIEILWTAQNVWVEVYFDQPSGTPPSVIRCVGIGQGISFILQDIEISMSIG